MARLLALGRWHVAERLEQALVVVPCDPLERRELDVLERLPRPAPPDLFRLEQSDHRLGQSVIVPITHAAHPPTPGLDPTTPPPRPPIARCPPPPTVRCTGSTDPAPAIAVMHQRRGRRE